MAKFSEHFDLGKTQAELDFVDVDLDTDTPLYICPYAIEIRSDEWSSAAGDHIRSFFNELLDLLRAENNARVEHILDNLHEPNETFLGESQNSPSGRAVGLEKAADIADAIRDSRAFETGVLGDVSEAELFISGIGRDTISDLTTNIIRGLLAEYTVAQCELLGLDTNPVRTLGPVWDIQARDWRAQELRLPLSGGRPVLLVPKACVRHRLTINSQEFYNHHMVEFLRTEYLAAGGALVRVFKKSGERYVTKKSVKERHPLIKDDLAAFVRDHPEVLETYKRIAGARGPLEIRDFDEDFDESAFAEALIERLNEIESGSDAATAYHKLTVGIATFLFHPHLQTPVKEYEVHQGRKRIDIKFTNAAQDGFFLRMQQSPQARSISLPMECKNYTKRVANPELDQLAGRFGHQRGFVGFLFCRNMDNRERIIAGCRDTANDQRGFMIVFEDADVIQMLEMVRDNHRDRIDRYLQQRFDELAG